MTTLAKCKALLKDRHHKKFFYSLTFKRHVEDVVKYKNGDKFRFNEELGKAYVTIIEELKHLKGEWANKLFILEDWQKAIVEILYGWEEKNSNGVWVRRFHISNIFMGRKNGKSIFASGGAIADTILRPSDGGEVKMSATKREQSKIVWDDIFGQMKKHPVLSKQIHSARDVLTYKPNNTTFTTLGNESTAVKEDGFNASYAVVDEVSSMNTRALIDIIESSMGSREQPHIMMIGTAGFNLGSPGYSEYEYSRNILLGNYDNPNYFAFICSPHDSKGKEFKKFSDNALYGANPNIGVSVKLDFLQAQRKSARQDSTKLVSYLTKHENRYVSQSAIFIDLDDWKRNTVTEEPDLTKATDKIIGLDLSINDDFTAKSCVYKFDDDSYYLKTHFYIPKDTVMTRERQVAAPLGSWVEDGYITATPGDFIDTDYIYNDLVKDIEDPEADFNIELNYDPFRAKQLISRVENEIGFECSATRQGYLTLSPATKLLLDLTKAGKLKHDGNPVMNWMISNLSVLFDPAGNMKPDKTFRDRKIDGVASTINCLVSLIEKIGEEEQSEIIWV